MAQAQVSWIPLPEVLAEPGPRLLFQTHWWWQNLVHRSCGAACFLASGQPGRPSVPGGRPQFLAMWPPMQLTIGCLLSPWSAEVTSRHFIFLESLL